MYLKQPWLKLNFAGTLKYQIAQGINLKNLDRIGNNMNTSRYQRKETMPLRISHLYGYFTKLF